MTKLEIVRTTPDRNPPVPGQRSTLETYGYQTQAANYQAQPVADKAHGGGDVLGGWHPIASAPRDGTWIIAAHAASMHFSRWLARQIFENGKLVDEAAGWIGFPPDQEQPTHWMLRPGLPKVSGA